MLFIRSFAFNFLFYSWTALCCLTSTLSFLMPMKVSLYLSKIWSKVSLGLAKYILGLDYRVEGAEHLPKTCGGFIVACKHQSTWETIVFSTLLENPSFVLKRSLMYIPFVGLFLKKLNMIPVERSTRSRSDLRLMLKKAAQVIHQGQPIVIFPEGTRTLPGEPSVYHTGVYSLYQHLNVPVVPIGLNSGLFWGRRTFLKKPGTISLCVGPLIKPGLKRADFMNVLKERIEGACTSTRHKAAHGFQATQSF